MSLLLFLLACSPSAEDIAKAVQSENPVMREDGAKIAQNYDDEVVVKALVGVIADPSEKVRLNAIESLAEIRSTDACPALADRMKNDPSKAVQKAAADALGRVICKEAVPDLIAYVDAFEVNSRDQLAGIWSIGRIGFEGLTPENKKAALAFLSGRREKASDKYVLYNLSVALRYLK